MEATTKKKYLIAILGVLSFVAILLYFFFNPENGLFPKCPFNNYLSIYCSGCGTQRAIHDLLHLRILDALGHNFLLLPAILVILQHVVVKIGIYKGQSLLTHRHAPLAILIVVLLFMVLRNLRMFPFEYLAP